jgi:hypothetical protein
MSSEGRFERTGATNPLGLCVRASACVRACARARVRERVCEKEIDR